MERKTYIQETMSKEKKKKKMEYNRELDVFSSTKMERGGRWKGKQNIIEREVESEMKIYMQMKEKESDLTSRGKIQ